MALTLIDLRTMRLPNLLTLPLALLGLGNVWMHDASSLPEHAASCVLGGGALYLVALSYRQFRGRDGLGMGDVKLFAAGGAWVGPSGLWSIMMIGAALGLAWVVISTRIRKQRTERIAFGPCLSAGIWLTWILGPLTIG